MKKGNRHYNKYKELYEELDRQWGETHYDLPKDYPKVIDEAVNVSKEDWKKIKLMNEIIKKTIEKEADSYWEECGDKVAKVNPLYVWYEENKNHRVYNKWYKELWWWIQERLYKPIRPMTKEARKHMKKVHKEKGVLHIKTSPRLLREKGSIKGK